MNSVFSLVHRGIGNTTFLSPTNEVASPRTAFQDPSVAM